MQTFNLYTKEAGGGELKVTVEGPSKAEMHIHENGDGSCSVDYKVSKSGEYVMGIKFNNEHIPESPFKVYVPPVTDEAVPLELASFPEWGAPGKKCAFSVLANCAPNQLEAKVRTPSNKIKPVEIIQAADGESYTFQFIPSETGVHYIDVTLNGLPIRNSPFGLRIRADCDPTAVIVSGAGIRNGHTGRECEFMVNTKDAGSGLLQIQVDGPSKVTLDACEVKVT
ncbi:unnamed protein product, partial [Gongylonema pulchrum]|uniref:Filamin-A n=1 Tax=Gongylonema pulchrum TaxID=637853 RepID=A0A183DKJ3_9BILA